MTARVDTFELAPGYRISRLIHGGWQTQGLDRKVALRSLHDHADAGVTTFETSDSYPGGEELLGRFRRERPGEDIRVHTRYSLGAHDPLPAGEEVAAAVDRSLEELGTAQIDLLQLQWWRPDPAGSIKVLETLRDLQAAGKIHLLGVTNFSTTMLAEALSADMPIVSNQVQYSLIDRRAENSLVDLCRARKIALLGYGPLCGGFLGPKWLEKSDPRPLAGSDHSREYRLMIDLFGGWNLYRELLGVLAAIAEKHKIGIPSVAARWVLERPGIGAVLMGASNARNLAANLELFSLALDDGDRAAIDDVLRRAHEPVGDPGELERDADGPMRRLIRTSRAEN